MKLTGPAGGVIDVPDDAADRYLAAGYVAVKPAAKKPEPKRAKPRKGE